MLGGGMSKVIQGLYVGGYRDSKDVAELEKHGITHIVAVHDTAKRILPDRQYLCISASDVPSQNLSQYFPSCSDFIHEARLSGGHVLIHCLAGMSRSVTVAVAYLMTVTSLNWQEALQTVRGVRPIANPNSGFQRQLEAFDGDRLCEERRRLGASFGESGRLRSEEDEVCCRKLLVACQASLRNGNLCQGRCVPPSRCPTGICRAHFQLFRARARKLKSPIPKPRSAQLPRKSLSHFRPYTSQKSGERRESVWSVASLPADGSLSEIYSDDNESECRDRENRPGTAPGCDFENDILTNEADKLNECLNEECDAPAAVDEPCKLQQEQEELQKKDQEEEQVPETSPKRFFIVGLNFRKLIPRNIFVSMPDLPNKSAAKYDSKPAVAADKLTLMKSPSSDCVLPLLGPRHAIPEITHAFEADDGIDPLTSEEDLSTSSHPHSEEDDRRRAESFVRNRWNQISALSRSQILRLSRAFRASRLTQTACEPEIDIVEDSVMLTQPVLEQQEVTITLLAQQNSSGANQ